MTTPGEYGGVSTVDTSAVAASIGAQVSQQAQELKRSVVNGSVELSTLGSIGAVLSVVVSCLNVLGNIVKLSPTRAVLMVYCFGGGLALLLTRHVVRLGLVLERLADRGVGDAKTAELGGVRANIGKR